MGLFDTPEKKYLMSMLLASNPKALADTQGIERNPLIDPTSVMGGSGAGLKSLLMSGMPMRQAISKALMGMGGEMLKEPAIGQTQEAIGQRSPAFAMLAPLLLGQIKAYHGSPYKFNKFDAAKIGSGEGAQSFGYGLNLTDSKDVAEWYAKKLSSYGDSPKALAFNMVRDHGKIRAREILQERMKGDRNYGFVQRMKEAIHAIENEDFGKVYHTTIHKGKDSSQYNYMRWDEPVTESMLGKLGYKIETADFGKKGFVATTKPSFMLASQGKTREETINNLLAQIRGKNLYYRLAQETGSTREASALLKRAGIDGIKYPSGSLSGVKDSKAFNYVVFDPKDISIDKVE